MPRHSIVPGVLLLLIATVVHGQQLQPNPSLQPIEDDPALPRVLLIGDSISIGYTLPTRKLLNGKANVHRPSANCGPTSRTLKRIDQWLGSKPWDVVHFNWGLHDLKYIGPNGANLADPADPTSRQQVPPAKCEANLRKLVARLKQTDAKLIWCSTTPVPEGAKGRVVGHTNDYNVIAAKVMNENDVAVHDLYAFAKDRQAQIQRRADVHFTPDGSQQLAQQVARKIEAALAEVGWALVG
jgi:acyl-CoA thioesterase-1